MQQNSAHFEEGIVRAIQFAWQTFDEWQSRMSAAVQGTWLALGAHMTSIHPDHEWISFSARSNHLLNPDTPLRDPESINYPSKADPSVIAVHTGYLERKKRFTVLLCAHTACFPSRVQLVRPDARDLTPLLPFPAPLHTWPCCEL
jgi:hypothetical protein